MNSIEWLKEKYINQNCSLTIIDFDKAKQLHKQEILDAYNKSFELRDKPYSTAHKYYQETFVSKGSDEEKTNSQRFDEFMQLVTSSQTEISDEEIEKAARDYDNSVIYGPPLLHFEQGAFWYREQLKCKTNE